MIFNKIPIIPNSSWYTEKSKESGVQKSCNYADVRKCHRYYESIYLLTNVGAIAGLDDDTINELDKHWKDKTLVPLIEEDRTSISNEAGKVDYLYNFCPEVSGRYYRYYASFMSKYVDHIDQDSGHRRAERDGLIDDWRYVWQTVVPCHYLDCTVFEKVKSFNGDTGWSFDNLIHKNIKSQIARMEVCLERNDFPGVLHASANVLETLAKDILNDPVLGDKTLGSFLQKYEKESELPEEIKKVAGTIYRLRNETPTAGHGSLKESNISMYDAIVISAATKFIVEVECRSRAISSTT